MQLAGVACRAAHHDQGVGAFVAYRWAGSRSSRLAVFGGLLAVSPSCAETGGAEPNPVSTVLFGTLEAGPAKTFGAIGMKRALGGSGLDSSGFRTLLILGASREQAQLRPPHGTTYKAEAQSLIGYEWRIGDTFLALYAGADYQGEQRPCQCGVAVTSVRFGPRLQADLWATPMPGMMLQAGAYVSSLDRRFWVRVTPGWALPQSFQPQDLYAGPEIEIYRERGYDKLRLGAHITGLRLFGLSWRLAAGWQRSSDRPAEPYATLGLHWRR